MAIVLSFVIGASALKKLFSVHILQKLEKITEMEALGLLYPNRFEVIKEFCMVRP